MTTESSVNYLMCGDWLHLRPMTYLKGVVVSAGYEWDTKNAYQQMILAETDTEQFIEALKQTSHEDQYAVFERGFNLPEPRFPAHALTVWRPSLTVWRGSVILHPGVMLMLRKPTWVRVEQNGK